MRTMLCLSFYSASLVEIAGACLGKLERGMKFLSAATVWCLPSYASGAHCFDKVETIS
jgi:hypothetical protein